MRFEIVENVLECSHTIVKIRSERGLQVQRGVRDFRGYKPFCHVKTHSEFEIISYILVKLRRNVFSLLSVKIDTISSFFIIIKSIFSISLVVSSIEYISSRKYYFDWFKCNRIVAKKKY